MCINPSFILYTSPYSHFTVQINSRILNNFLRVVFFLLFFPRTVFNLPIKNLRAGASTGGYAADFSAEQGEVERGDVLSSRCRSSCSRSRSSERACRASAAAASASAPFVILRNRLRNKASTSSNSCSLAVATESVTGER